MQATVSCSVRCVLDQAVCWFEPAVHITHALPYARTRRNTAQTGQFFTTDVKLQPFACCIALPFGIHDAAYGFLWVDDAPTATATLANMPWMYVVYICRRQSIMVLCRWCACPSRQEEQGRSVSEGCCSSCIRCPVTDIIACCIIKLRAVCSYKHVMHTACTSRHMPATRANMWITCGNVCAGCVQLRH
jgi:hypothetical protein